MVIDLSLVFGCYHVLFSRFVEYLSSSCIPDILAGSCPCLDLLSLKIIDASQYLTNLTFNVT